SSDLSLFRLLAPNVNTQRETSAIPGRFRIYWDKTPARLHSFLPGSLSMHLPSRFSSCAAGLLLLVLVGLVVPVSGQPPKEKLYLDPINVQIPHITTDKSIRYDYDIVYVRALRDGDEVHKRWYTDFSQPVTMEPGADLMLLHPNGSEELLVAGGEG